MKLSIVSFITSFLFGLGYSILVSRFLGVEARGIFYQYQMVSLVFATICYSSFSQVCFEYFRDTAKKVTDVTKYIAGIVLFVTAISLLFSWGYAYYTKGLDWRLLFALIISQGVMIFGVEASKYFIGLAHFYKVTIAQVLFPFITVLAFYGLVGNFDVHDAVVSSSIAYVTVSVISLWAISKYRVKLDPVNQTRFISRFGSLFFVRAFSTVTNYLERLLLVAVCDAKVLGAISICYSLETVSSRFYQFLANLSANKLAKNDASNLDKINLISVSLGVGGLLASYLIGDLIITLLFGAEFEYAFQYLLYVIAVSVLNGICWVSSQKWLLSQSLKYVYIRQWLSLFVPALAFSVIYVSTQALSVFDVLSVAVFTAILRLVYTLFINKYVQPKI